MTPTAFDALAELAGCRDSPAREAARMVLVDGVAQSEAARRADITRQSVNGVLLRFRHAQELAMTACGAE